MVIFKKAHYEFIFYSKLGGRIYNSRNGLSYDTDGYRWHRNIVPSTWIHGEAQAQRFVRRCEAHGVTAPVAVVAVAQGEKSCAGYIKGWI